MAIKKKQNIAIVIIMIVVTLLMLTVLTVNMTLIVKGALNKDVPPDIFGIAPLAVSSDSMSGNNPDSFSEGALIFVKLLDEEGVQLLEEGEIVTFRLSDSFVTHRIVSVFRENGKAVSFVTQGDANAVTDGAIPSESIFGKCVASVNGLGGLAMFMQTPIGILVFVGVPILIYIAYDVVRIVLHNKRVKSRDHDAIEEKNKEIERLRAIIGERDIPTTENDADNGGNDK